MECGVCALSATLDEVVQLLPCLHVLCNKCMENIGKYSKTCPWPHCFSPLRQQPDMRLNKCDSPLCRRRLAPASELFVLDCEHGVCCECQSELFRGRRSAFCPECEAQVAGEGEEACDTCCKLTLADKATATSCCGAKICTVCVERSRREKEDRDDMLKRSHSGEEETGKENSKENSKGGSKEDKEESKDKENKEGIICPGGKCPKRRNKKKKGESTEKAVAANRCACGMLCENEALPNFPSESECEHEVCQDCLEKSLEHNEKKLLQEWRKGGAVAEWDNVYHLHSELVPTCPNETCRTPYRSESVLALRVLFPDRKKYFDTLGNLGYHFGYEQLKDEMITEVEFGEEEFNAAQRMVMVKVAVAEDEDSVVSIEFDRKGTFGDLLREARRALKIGATDKLYGYYLRLEGQDKCVVLTPELVSQELCQTISTKYRKKAKSEGWTYGLAVNVQKFPVEAYT